MQGFNPHAAAAVRSMYKTPVTNINTDMIDVSTIDGEKYHIPRLYIRVLNTLGSLSLLAAGAGYLSPDAAINPLNQCRIV